MLTILLLMIGVVVLVLVLLAVVVIGIKQEPTAEQMTSQPPSAITARKVIARYRAGHRRVTARPKLSAQMIRPAGWCKALFTVVAVRCR